MKGYKFVFLLTTVLGYSAMAQDSSAARGYRGGIKLNLLSPIYSTANVAVEVNTGKDYSLQLGLAYMNHTTFGTTDGLTKAIFITPELRYELMETRHGHAFIGLFTRYIDMEYTQSETWRGVKKKSTADYQSIGVGVIIGQKFVFKNKVAIEFFAGPVYSGILKGKNDFYNRASDDLIVDQDVPLTLLSKYGLRAGFTVGWLF